MDTKLNTTSEQKKKNQTTQAIQSAELAYEGMLERQLEELCNLEEEEPDTFEFSLLEKTYQLYYGGKGSLPTFSKEQRPKDIHFIESLTPLPPEGMYKMVARPIATSEYIRRELEQLEVPVKEWKATS